MSGAISVEFSARNGEVEFKEESVTLKNVDEFFDFVAPQGGCESIPSEVDEIQMVFLPPAASADRHALANEHVSVQLGMVVFSGPLQEISETLGALLERAGQGKLSESFLTVSGVKRHQH